MILIIINHRAQQGWSSTSMGPTFLQGVILQAVGKHQDHSNYVQKNNDSSIIWLVVLTILKKY